MVKERAIIVSQQCIGTDIYDMVLSFPKGAKEARPGQFIAMYCEDGTKLLPRPISICGIDAEAGTLRVVYRIAGEGTRLFSQMKAGDSLEVMGPLGNGFTMKDKKAIIVGGGIGIPPMLELAKQLDCEKTVVLGYRDELFLKEEFEACADVAVATEDGSAGMKGTVIDAIKAAQVSGEIIYACGPMPMLKALAEYADAHGMEAQISLEERMACGIGACLGCICKTKEKDHHTNVNNTRICKDGPVFDAKEVVFA
ncbi:MAG TPA: dihydroorotate dehydrogenase electron transfer subunit [Candidatus Anaerobutyricum stercoripullorum]|uniref:Dihydroorotate dehydrogenase B (NAD(+)), electron transfer subunit n=1 Tax=Candidatus Anaerobutyricum stercoripullorum TaxID=2838456 RepID=A0A9D1X2Y2_9FIRM|nr:dihydroorotate dehydrogenase electron transfer subunit [Candidatus Anaerobutyricum stercoripullorum]